MRKNVGKLLGRTSWLVIETLAVAAILLGLVAGVGVWRLSTGPMDVSFARGYVEAALRDDVRGTHASMESMVMHWPDLGGPLLLGLKNAKIHKTNGDVLISVDEVALALSKADLLLGKISPEAVILKNPHLRIVRAVDGSVDVGFAAASSAGEIDDDNFSDQSSLVERVLSYIAHPGEDSDSSPLGSLQSFEIENAKLSVEDEIIQETWVIPHMNALIQSTNQGLAAEVSASLDFNVDLPAMTVPQSTFDEEFELLIGAFSQATILEARMDMPWGAKTVSFQGQIANFHLSSIGDKFPGLFKVLGDYDMPIDLSISGELDSNFKPVVADISLASAKGWLELPELYRQPLDYSDLVIDLRYQDDPRLLAMKKVKITAGGIPLEMEAEIEIGPEEVSGPVRLKISDLAHSSLAPLWPKFLEEDNSREWIIDRLSGGTFHDAYADMHILGRKGTAGEDGWLGDEWSEDFLAEWSDHWSFDVRDLQAGFSFENMSVDYRAPLIPATQASGSGFFDYEADTMTIDIQKAMIDDMTVSKGKVELARIIEKGAGTAAVDVSLSGPLSSVFRYAEKEPINQSQDFDVAAVGGHAALEVRLDFPLSKDVKKEDVDINITGALENVSIPNVTKNLNFTEGLLDLTIQGNDFTLAGKGKLDGAPINLTYQGFVNSDGQPFRRKLMGDFSIDQAMRQKLGINIDMLVDGSFPVRIVHTEYSDSNPSTVTVTADLTPGRLMFDPFDYEKLPGQVAEASLVAVLAPGGDIAEVRELKAKGPNFLLENTTLIFQKRALESELHVGYISRFQIDETIAKMSFEIEPSGRIKVVLEGPFLDLRPFLNAEGDDQDAKETPAMLISVAVDRMRPSDGQTVEYGKMYVDLDTEGRFNQLELDAIAGSGDVYLRYKPDETGARVFRFEADDAGATLKAFGVYDKIVGGTMVIYAQPIENIYDRNLVGAAELRDFKVVKAPSLAKLLSAISLPGMINLLNNDGLGFSKLKANFDWLYRSNGSLLILKDGRTSGNSLGLTFDGTFDNAASTIDVSGTIVPLSEVNKIISKIPLVGDILTGGSGSLFAATYTMKGDAKEPNIAVNPLAVLAPGILRRILFE